MRADDAKRFLEALAENPSLQRRFHLIAENSRMVIGFALSRGYRFTERELRTALAEYPDHPVINELRTKWQIDRPLDRRQ